MNIWKFYLLYEVLLSIICKSDVNRRHSMQADRNRPDEGEAADFFGDLS